MDVILSSVHMTLVSVGTVEDTPTGISDVARGRRRSEFRFSSLIRLYKKNQMQF
jgi:hypothetical protein